MHVFLVRHGETEHNIAGLLAGVTDSNLTNHGILQTQRLAQHLVTERGLRFSHVFASDLKRAYMTADELIKAQNAVDKNSNAIELVKLAILREQDFGSRELVPWSSKRTETNNDKHILTAKDAGFKPKETREAMKVRADTYLEDFVSPLLVLDTEQETTVAIVSHGLFLASLWRSLLAKFSRGSITFSSNIDTTSQRRPLEHVTGWGNTGYLELSIKSSSPIQNTLTEISTSHERNLPFSPFSLSSMVIERLDSREHLRGLKRARGGIGSSAFDVGQTKLETFFKKRKLDHK